MLTQKFTGLCAHQRAALSSQQVEERGGLLRGAAARLRGPAGRRIPQRAAVLARGQLQATQARLGCRNLQQGRGISALNSV